MQVALIHYLTFEGVGPWKKIVIFIVILAPNTHDLVLFIPNFPEPYVNQPSKR